MDDPDRFDRRTVLRTTGAALVTATGIGALGNAAAERGDGREFGRVYANDVLWRTNVVRVLDEAPDPNDDIYFLHDGDKPVVAREDVSEAQASPFVSESAPGDRDWTGGQWVHHNAEVTDIVAFNDDAPVASVAELLDADYIETARGRPTNADGDPFGPPNYFVCPLNGRA